MQDLKRLASYAAKGCRAELLRTAETLLGSPLIRHGFTTIGELNLHKVGRPLRLVYLCEQVVIGPANHGYRLEVAAKNLCRNRASVRLRSFSIRGSQKGKAVLRWFSEPPNKALVSLFGSHYFADSAPLKAGEVAENL